ncbi:MAG: preprotein translocase subunit SecG [Balneola sp.]|mgnify:CR=1 FL=1|jgi:preprotein translocase subunit SecG
MLYNILVAVITIICALLILVVLLQNGQGSGLSGISGGGGGGALGGNSGLGARRTADLLSKATGIFGGAFLVLCILANFAIDRTGNGPSRSILQDGGAPVQDLNAPSQTQSAVPIQNEEPRQPLGSEEDGDN